MAASIDDAPFKQGIARVVSVMVRARSQTPEAYWPSLQVYQWETPVEKVLLEPKGDGPQWTALSTYQREDGGRERPVRPVKFTARHGAAPSPRRRHPRLPSVHQF